MFTELFPVLPLINEPFKNITLCYLFNILLLSFKYENMHIFDTHYINYLMTVYCPNVLESYKWKKWEKLKECLIIAFQHPDEEAETEKLNNLSRVQQNHLTHRSPKHYSLNPQVMLFFTYWVLSLSLYLYQMGERELKNWHLIVWLALSAVNSYTQVSTTRNWCRIWDKLFQSSGEKEKNNCHTNKTIKYFSIYEF